MTRLSKYSPEFRERAARVARQSERSISAVARDLGIHPETLRLWVRQDEADDGTRSDQLTTAEREELTAPRRENRDLKRSNEILKAASGLALCFHLHPHLGGLELPRCRARRAHKAHRRLAARSTRPTNTPSDSRGPASPRAGVARARLGTTRSRSPSCRRSSASSSSATRGGRVGSRTRAGDLHRPVQRPAPASFAQDDQGREDQAASTAAGARELHSARCPGNRGNPIHRADADPVRSDVTSLVVLQLEQSSWGNHPDNDLQSCGGVGTIQQK